MHHEHLSKRTCRRPDLTNAQREPFQAFYKQLTRCRAGTPEYISKFPTNLAPAIEHDDFCISESNAIMRYVVTTFPDKAGKFYPNDRKKRATIDMIAEYSGITVYNLIAKSMYPDVGFPLYAGDVNSMDATKEKTAESQAAAAAELLGLLEAKYEKNWLAKTKFLAGDEPTIADLRFGPMLLFARVAVKIPARLVKYMDDLVEVLPGYKDAIEFGGHGPKPFTEAKKK